MSNICEQKMVRWYSFDIFDTLVTRITASPVGVFDVMQEILCDSDKYKNIGTQFSYVRKISEVAARDFASIHGNQEIGIETIYEYVGEMLSLSRTDIEELIELEFNTEKRCLVPVTKNIEKIKELLRSNKRVFLISDIYWNNDRIRSLLCQIDDVFNEIPIYTSASIGYTKKHGDLYLYIKNEEAIGDCCEWCHVGDNLQSDVLIPRMVGINAMQYKPIDIPDWMMSIAKECADTSLNFELQIGVLKCLKRQIHENKYRALGIGYGGVIIYQFAVFVTELALKENINCLYFMARDGFLVKKAVDAIVEARQLGIKTQYLYISSAVCREDRYKSTGQEDWEEHIYRLKSFLEENIDFEENCAFVDTQGSGVSMESIAKITEDNRNDKLNAIYYALIRPKEIDSCNFRFFRFERNDFIEILCRAPHGRVIGYREVDKRMLPMMDDEPYEDELYEYQDGVIQYVKCIEKTKKAIGMNISGRVMGENYIHYIPRQPNLRMILAKLTNNNGYEFKINSLRTDDKKNIVVYGAGNVGTNVIRRAEESCQINVIGWTDIDCEKYIDLGYPIIPFEEALDLPYDNIVVAIYDEVVSKGIVNMIKSRGVDGNKILELHEVDL